MKLCTWLPRSLGVKRCLQKAERRPSVVSKEGCTGYLIPVIVWGASQSPKKPKGACQSLPSLRDFSVSPRTLKQRGNSFTVACIKEIGHEQV